MTNQAAEIHSGRFLEMNSNIYEYLKGEEIEPLFIIPTSTNYGKKYAKLY